LFHNKICEVNEGGFIQYFKFCIVLILLPVLHGTENIFPQGGVA